MFLFSNTINMFLRFFIIILCIFINFEIKANDHRKQWGNLSVELKKKSFIGKNVQLEFLFENLSELEENFSSVLYLESRSSSGDRGEMSWTTYTDCDGMIPPLGFFKCKVQFDFPTNLDALTVKIGAGIVTKAVFFKISK
tara:strand:- start:103 stop:522 length:420 start_codon:yes stop_codon:yes gene_type:complete